MGTDKLKELEVVTDRINANLNNIVNTATTAELEKITNEVNKDLEKQKELRKETGIDQNKSNDTQIKSVNIKLQHQEQTLKKVNVEQKSNVNNIEKSFFSTEKWTNKYWKQQAVINKNQAGTYNAMTHQSKYKETPADISLTAPYFAFENRKMIAKMTGKGIQLLTDVLGVGWLGDAIQAGIDITVEAFEQMLAIVKEVISTVTKIADKFEEFVSTADEAVRSTLQSLGYVMTENFGTTTKSDRIAKNILDASNYMVQTIGIAFSPEKVAEIQKAYGEISKTNLAFHSSSLVTMSEVQTVLDLSAQQTTEFYNLFVQMGGGINLTTNFMEKLIFDSSKVGINTKKVLSGLKEYMKASERSRFGPTLNDLSNMVTYAHRIRIDLGGMLKLMNKVSDPEAAIDLAAQLQALDTVYLGLDPIDLMGAAINDVEKFTQMITDPLLENISKFYDEQTGQLTQRGRMFTDNMLKLDGMSEVFKSQEDVINFFAKAGKEKTIRKAIFDSATSYASYMQLTPEQQKDIIGLLAEQAQITDSGIKITTTGQDVSKLSKNDMVSLMEPGVVAKSWGEAAAGTVSIQDQEELNKELVASISSTTDSINKVHTLLRDGKLIQTLQDAGRIISEVGMYYFDSSFYKQLDTMVDIMGLTMQEAYIFQGLMGTGETFDKFSSGFRGLMEGLGSIAVGLGFDESEFKPKELSQGGIVNVSEIQFSRPTIQAYSKFVIPQTRSSYLSNLLQLYNTSKSGPGVINMSNNRSTEVIVSGEIRNYINDKDAGVLSGEKVYDILEKNLTK